MARPALEVADIFRGHGAAWRDANAGRDASLGQLQVMSAIDSCRTAALGGHVADCDRLRPPAHRLQLLPQPPLPQVPGPARAAWLGEAPPNCCPSSTSTWSSPCRRNSVRLALQNPRLVYGVLFQASARALLSWPPNPQHLGAEIGLLGGAAHLGPEPAPTPARPLRRPRRWHLTRRATAGSPAGRASSCRCVCWAACSAGSSWRCLAAHVTGLLGFHGQQRHLADPQAFPEMLEALRRSGWCTPSRRSAAPNRC